MAVGDALSDAAAGHLALCTESSSKLPKGFWDALVEALETSVVGRSSSLLIGAENRHSRPGKGLPPHEGDESDG